MKKIMICIFIIIILIVLVVLFVKNILYQKSFENIKNNDQNVLSDKDNLLLYIDEIKRNNNNILIAGKIISGTINKKDEISIVGLGKKEINTQIINLNVNGTDTNVAKSGEYVCITIDANVDMEYIQVGMAVITSQTDKPVYNINARISETTIDFKDIIKEVNIFYINTDIKCNVSNISKENNEIKISLDVPIVVKKDLQVILKKNDKVIAKATVIE